MRLPGSLWLGLSFLIVSIAPTAASAACASRLSTIADTAAICGGEARLSDTIAAVESMDSVEDLSFEAMEVQPTPAGETRFGIEIVSRLGAKTVSPADLLWFQAAFAEADLRDNLATLQPQPRASQAERPQAGLQPDGWFLSAGLLYHWLPNLRHAFFTSLAWQEPPRAALRGHGDDKAMLTIGSGTRLTWSPVDGVDLGLEVLYARTGEFVHRRVGFKDMTLDGKIDARLRFNKEF
ncbi:hypothetical protein [Chelatococcus asaccharovorans]|uniref:Uncharacterized protein n=1 Tax=Chelatococcus asaccharovorans TaxID=28210 RepID=A0A2V3UB37_9HYPH|nr:hypothetical protein [Chelatococcus asaccharovorans]MBS7703396.1 hypothetical protein [Chelatococcus asaccharovorans]PXW61734.1 hypothetical protein C7450_103252 [Chelatococcus asaccharovorans]CAH1671413.1 conserved exported hypothetical protein [Chelatococcus asaccharovorans]CAH1677166.1 conserved exported hypothetical protein [Chelatococcus asaccharovorans]